MNGSIEQRLELLRGLLDSDGTCHRSKPRVSFTTVSRRIRDGFLELLWSLGFKPTFRTRKTEGKDAHEINFTSHRADVFHLKRKRDRLVSNLCSGNGRSRQRFVVGVDEVETEPVKCIKVDNEDSSYLVGREHIVTHNTTQLGVWRTLWKLGKNPNLRATGK